MGFENIPQVCGWPGLETEDGENIYFLRKNLGFVPEVYLATLLKLEVPGR